MGRDMMMQGLIPGAHMLWVAVVILILCILLIVLIRALRSPPSEAVVQKFEERFSAPPSMTPPSGPQSREPVREDILIVIPDISGYTRFIEKSRFALAHAHFVIEELLAAIMQTGKVSLRPMRIEGDAIVFHTSRGSVNPTGIGETVVGILEAFYRKRAQLKHDNVCRCAVCKNIDELDLKIIMHSGEVLKFKMGDFEDVTGEAMITAHRLLKGVEHTHRYVLVTEQARDTLDLPETWAWEEHSALIDGLEQVRCFITVLSDELINKWDQEGMASGSVADFLNKLLAVQRYSGLPLPGRKD